MGGIIFIIAAIAGIYVASYFRRSLLDLPNGRSKRISLDLSKIRSIKLEPIVVTPILNSLILAPALFTAPSNPDSEVCPNFTINRSSIEESLLFRVLVYGMMVLSTMAIDLVAKTHYGWVAIPMMSIGTVWSWYRRHHVKHWLNWLMSAIVSAISIGWLMPILAKDLQAGIERAEPAFQTQIAIGLGLGLISVVLSMGLSFYLYNRRFLGYGMTMSLISIGVVASLSHNLSFLLLLSVFMAIGIPALMLDYRSRIALPPIGITDLPNLEQLSYQHLPWQYLSKLAAISIGMGLIVSLFLPNYRFPDLTFQPDELEKLTAHAPKDLLPKLDPKSPPPQTAPGLPPQIDPSKLAAQVLGKPDNNHYPDTIKTDNLQLPPTVAAQLQDFTKQILATSPQPLDSDYDRAAYLGEYLKQHHQDSPQQSNLPPIDPQTIEKLIASCNLAPKSCKLVRNKQDLPIVYTSMLRSIDIPARLKTGDKLAEFDPKTQTYLRPPESIESQTEVYFPNWGWFNLDPTPDRPLLNLDDRQITQLQQQSQQLSPSPSPTPSALPNQPTPIPTTETTPPSKLPKWEPDPTIVKMMLISIAICGGIIWYLIDRYRKKQYLATLAPVEQIYRSMVANLSKGGLIKHPAQTQLEYAQSANNIYHPQIVKVTQEISQLYTAWRYGKQRIDVKQLTKKLRYLEHLQQLAAKKHRQKQIVKFKDRWK
jgi:putative Mn2+ efflux pump MntP